MRLPKTFQKNILVKPSIVIGSYTEASSDPTPAEVDISTAKKVMIYADVQTLNSDPLVLTLKECDESGGTFTTVVDDDGDDIKISIDETGQFKVNAHNTEQYLKVVATQDSGVA